MKTKKTPVIFSQQLLLLLVFLFLCNTELWAQCSVCRASAESSLESSEVTVASGLNKGILYLMAIPYLVFMGIIFYFFKKQILYRVKLVRDKFLS